MVREDSEMTLHRPHLHCGGPPSFRPVLLAVALAACGRQGGLDAGRDASPAGSEAGGATSQGGAPNLGLGGAGGAAPQGGGGFDFPAPRLISPRLIFPHQG